MCLSTVGRVRETDGATAVVEADGAAVTVSLAPLVLDGQSVARGDWIVAQTGLAVRRLTAQEAAAIGAARQEIVEEER